ncbi:hypothetical protein CB1_000830002 [Camelus ferus]|nr:hypothetical protein CB1_000830002 [Camelus ferus]
MECKRLQNEWLQKGQNLVAMVIVRDTRFVYRVGCQGNKVLSYIVRQESSFSGFSQTREHLSSVSHIVLDEIHERNLQSDVLMTVIKDLLSYRPDLKVILMSATLNAEKFSEYFEEELHYREVRKKAGYSASTVDVMEMMDDDKVDLNLIAALIRYIVLQEENALDKQEELTPLGVHLARLPVEPHIGKMILFGALFCCLDPVLTIAASLSFKDPFVIPLGKEKVADARRKELAKDTKSDHLTVVNAFEMLHNMKGQFAEHLLGAGFVSSRNPKDPKSNINSDNEKIIKAVICAGLYPKVAKIRLNLGKKRKM